MTEPAFDTLEAARRLKAADIQAKQADAIVEVVNQSTSQFVTVERFDAAIATLHARIDSVHSELNARIDSVHSELSAKIDSVQAELLARMDSMRSELRAEFARSHVRTLIVVIAANALMLTVLGLILSRGAPLTPPFGAP